VKGIDARDDDTAVRDRPLEVLPLLLRQERNVIFPVRFDRSSWW